MRSWIGVCRVFLFSFLTVMAAAVVAAGKTGDTEDSAVEMRAVGNAVQIFRRLLPNSSKYKGSSGRICTMGGSEEYTGAPYYCGMAALLTGAELSIVVTESESARNAIKAYSPELIVQPALDEAMLRRCTAVSIGSGLGRSDAALTAASEMIRRCLSLKTPLVLDADALWLLATVEGDAPSLHSLCVLTPNAMEFQRLFNRFVTDEPRMDVTKQRSEEASPLLDGVSDGYFYLCDELSPLSESIRQTVKLARKLGGSTVIRKGRADIISDGSLCALVRHPSIPRRCGGQGDVLAGICSAMIHPSRAWSSLSDGEVSSLLRNDSFRSLVTPALIAAVSASTTARHAAFGAWKRKLRSTLSTDLLSELPATFNRLFPYDDECPSPKL